MAWKQHPEGRLVRCAIYTRKSTTAGLDLRVNSLETQREVCQSYIRCQEHRNWIEVPERYDDGGFSGGTLDRPALKRLISDIEIGRVDIVVIYKIDRLSRSLTDFIRLMDVMERYQTSFVSVTQTFDTSDSMGRLVLNILLTFAQFERELMSERIKDRYAARRKRGLFGGGTAPVGYMVRRGGKLIHDPERADTIRSLFYRYPTSSAAQLAKDLRAQNFVTRRYVSQYHGRERGGQKFTVTQVLNILRNPLYAGYFRHGEELIKADVQPLISLEKWQSVQDLMAERIRPESDPVTNWLLGILHDEIGRPMRIVNDGIGRSERRRHYWSQDVVWARGAKIRKVMVQAERVEQLTISTLQGLLTDRKKLKETILSLGMYDSETGRIIKLGHLAARRIALMTPAQTRELIVALVPRAEVTRYELRLFISTYELARFLAWDGERTFRKASNIPRGVERFRMVYAPAYLINGHSYFSMPILPKQKHGNPDPELIRILADAQDAKDLAYSNRDLGLSELARKRRVSGPMFTRLMRVNYLAPDIQAAIIDGTHPPDLTRTKILYGSLPLDWEQQRHLLGFSTSP